MKRLIRRMVTGVLLVVALALAGCGQRWTHPYIAGPRDEDKQFEKDSALCEEKVAQVPEAERQAAFENCLIRLGWERKD